MADYGLERECRTPYSEVYTVLEEDEPIGRLDIHLTPVVIHATLCIDESLTQEAIQELISYIDDEVVDVVGVSRDEFIIHVHQGHDVGVFSNHEDFDGNGGREGA
ncbi:MAG: hypothetical protein O2783_01980 [Chloroflexi bacterium]|nr:hypothetical protein [Chloroflexota bacterium]